VPSEQARGYADEINALFIETSAKEDTNVTALFIDISKRLPASSQQAKLPDIHDLSDPGNRPKGALHLHQLYCSCILFLIALSRPF
jgi:hypothetical protein